MKIKDGKIAAATDEELFGFYLSRGWDELFSYPEYKRRCVAAGTKIIDDEEAQK